MLYVNSDENKSEDKNGRRGGALLMLFSSIVFLCFFLPVVLLGNYLLSFSRGAQNIFLLFASLFFYAWGEPVYVLIMIASIVLNYIFSLLVEKFDDSFLKKRMVLVASIVTNLSVLFVFKYLGFVIRNINQLAGKELLKNPNLALPIGISFFTFQALSYVIDVYRKDAVAEKNLFYLGLYISFFPQLIAGPIVRYNTVADQIRNRQITWNKFTAGCSRFAMGLCKKILLANQFAIIADYVYGKTTATGEVPAMLAWVGIFGYMLQLFFDFSSYSDMAIGLGLMFGFQFGENFNYPYVAKSVSEFWRRWHISLTTWFHEYVYFPLGGSRVKNQDKVIRNLFIVWMLTGIWHGAEWTFILWGFWNFVFIFLEKLFDFETNRVPAFFKHIYLIWVVAMGFVMFRATDLTQGLLYFRNLYGFSGNGFFSEEAIMLVKEYWIFWILGILVSTPFAKRLEKTLVEGKSRIAAGIATAAYPIGLFVLCVVSFSYLVRGSYNPFIYFNF
ncbi:MAG: MBOAT family O-acyltransferase [Roseburia sp.]